MDGEDGLKDGRRRRRALRWLGGSALAFALVSGAVWTQRRPIARDFVQGQLDSRGVRATYDLTQVSARTQRIEHLVLGDPKHPDLTAEWVEVDVGVTGGSPGVTAIRARGVRLYGQYRNGVLSLGELDKFRSAQAGAPFSLPDMNLAIADARVRIATDYGKVGLKIEGEGNLHNGFDGKTALIMAAARFGDCTLERPSAWLDVHVNGGEPQLIGPIRARALGCAGNGLALAKPEIGADVTLGTAFDRWTGRLTLAGEAARAGSAVLSKPAGEMLFDGGMTETRGQFALRAAGAGQADFAAAGAVSLDGRWRVRTEGGLRAEVQGRFAASDLRYGGDDPMGGLRQTTAGSPVGPLAVKLADAMRDLGRGNRLTGRYALAQKQKGGAVVLTSARIDSASGAHVGLGSGARFTLRWPDGRWALQGGLTSEGGGLPKAALRLVQRPNGGFGGQLFADPYTAGNARLAIEPVRFTAPKGGGTAFSTALMLDGPVGDGWVKGLSLPLSGRFAGGGLVVNRACAPLSVEQLEVAGARIGRSRIQLCPVGGALVRQDARGLSGGGEARNIRLIGIMSSSPMRMAASAARFTVGDPGFGARGLDWSVGSEASPVRLTANALSGRVRDGGVSGAMDGVTGQIGAVPLLVEDASGQWMFANGALRVNGDLRVRDAAVPDRFNPLRSRDFSLALEGGRIVARGTLLEPRTGSTIAKVDIAHALGSGKGQADLLVPSLTFTDSLQPDDITRLALGVVANASGTVTGRGQVRWQGDKVTSDGTFRTDSMDLAAAFGPVKGLAGEIHFTDLIGLVTADGQVARIASVNPGIEATDGLVRYHLEPEQKVRIEGGEWPFSGGRLILLPTTLDFSADTERYITFRVIGLDAGAFIQKLELENVSATGTFDGIMPLIFNAQGGRISGGVLVARQAGLDALYMPEGVLPSIPCDPTRQGGTLSYVGPVSNEQVGAMGKIAFDALKDLQYKCLSILMDGALDGEMVTNVVFNGVNRGKVGDAPDTIARSFIGLPFLFNVRIQAPFRGLLGTAQSFIDPSGLVRDHIGNEYQEKLREGVAVQPSESDNRAGGARK